MNYLKYINLTKINDSSHKGDKFPLLRDFILSEANPDTPVKLKFRKRGKRKFDPELSLELALDEWIAHPGWRLPRKLWLSLKASLLTYPVSSSNEDKNRKFSYAIEDYAELERILSVCIKVGLSRHHSRGILTTLIKLSKKLNLFGNLSELDPSQIINECAYLLQSNKGGSRLLLETGKIFYSGDESLQTRLNEYKDLLSSIENSDIKH